jgi:type IV secretion system protein TrbL
MATPQAPAGPCLPMVDEICSTVGDAITGGVSHVAGAVAANWLEQLAEAMATGAGKVLAWTLSWWVHADSPAIDQPGSVSSWLQGRLLWLTLFAAVAGLLVGAARIALTGPRAAREVAEGLTRLLVVAAVGVPVIAACTIAGDEFSEWILSQVDANALGQGLFDVSGAQINAAYGPAVLAIVALLGLLTGLVQILLLLVRAAMLVILAGVLPTMAASSLTETGLQAYKRAIAWTVAFLLYKPLAAVIYAAALKGMSRPDADTAPGPAETQIIGVLTLMLALVALPALMRVVAPVIGHVASGGAGRMVAGGAVATGARPLARSFASPAGAGRVGAGRAAVAGAGAGAAASAVAAPLLAAQIAERMASGARTATQSAAGNGLSGASPPPQRQRPPGDGPNSKGPEGAS